MGGDSQAGREVTITIRNNLDVPVAIYWVNFEGELTKYHDIDPGKEVTQHTFIGHLWEAEANGVTVSRFSATSGNLDWTIEPNE